MSRYLDDLKPEHQAFLDDIVAVYRKHNLSLGDGHQDFHGSLVIEPLSESNIKWLMRASADETTTQIKP